MSRVTWSNSVGPTKCPPAWPSTSTPRPSITRAAPSRSPASMYPLTRSAWGRRDQRSHVDTRAVAGADGERRGARREPRHERVTCLADRHHGRDRHAALAGRAVGGADQSVGGRVEIGVRQHDGVVLGATQRLHPFPLGASGFIDVPGDRRRADERDCRHVGVRQEGVDRVLVAMHDVEDAVGQSGLFQQFRGQHAGGRVLFRRFQHERVPTGQRHGRHPHRAHDREIEGGDPCADPSGCLTVCESTPAPTSSECSPFSKWGMPVANSTTSSPRCTEPAASESVLPCSSVMTAARSPCRRSSRSRNRMRIRARRIGVVARHAGNARRALPTAASTSAALANGTVRTTSPVAELVTVPDRGPRAA